MIGEVKNVLVIGSGGREHALCWAIRKSPICENLFCAPGNPGTKSVAENINVAADDIEGLLRAAVSNKIGFVIVGPELPLSLGITDVFESAGIKVLGPSKAAACLESSKAFAKEIMKESGVQNASYNFFDNLVTLKKHLQECPVPVVVKVDGLAGGKGVFVCQTRQDALMAIDRVRELSTDNKVIVEEFLEGKEISLIVATNGEDVLPLSIAHDYKRLLDYDLGPNTGGMGSVSPSPRLPKNMSVDDLISVVIKPVLSTMKRRNIPFRGFLYAGLMLGSDETVRVLEFNARLGDPETQALLRRVKGDLLENLISLYYRENRYLSMEWDSSSAVCVVLAASGYPYSVHKGDVITGIDKACAYKEVVVFHAGTKETTDGSLVTNGGRVLNVTAVGNTIEVARRVAYEAVDEIKYNGQQVRKDIGLV